MNERGKLGGRILGVCLIIAVVAYVVCKCAEIIFGVKLW